MYAPTLALGRTHLNCPLARARANVQYPARIVEGCKEAAALEEHLQNLVVEIHPFGLELDERQSARGSQRRGSGVGAAVPGRWGTDMLDEVSRGVISKKGRLTAGLVAVVGPAIFSYEVEDALVDRLSAPVEGQRGQWQLWDRTTDVSQLSMPSEGSD